MSQHGVVDNDCGKSFFFIQWGWLGINCAGTGGDGDHLVNPCRTLFCTQPVIIHYLLLK